MSTNDNVSCPQVNCGQNVQSSLSNSVALIYTRDFNTAFLESRILIVESQLKKYNMNYKHGISSTKGTATQCIYILNTLMMCMYQK